MAGKQKLELTWIGKESRPRLEPRILLEDPAKSYHAPHRVSDNDFFDNRLIFGDNLLALKALEQEFTGKVKCIFIDPPYNTGSAFTHYDDGVEHSLWLSLMRHRLEVLWRLLQSDGSIWISLDDNECHYLKVLMDELFGRSNFVASVIWQKIFSPKSSAQFLSVDHDYVLVYAKDASQWRRNLLPRSEAQDSRYKNPDNDSRGPWLSDNMTARNPYSQGIYSVTTPSGRVIEGPPAGRYWAISKDKFEELDRDRRIWWGKTGANMPRLKRFLSDVQAGVVPQTIWLHTEAGNTQEAKKEVIAAVPKGTEVFATPKPERLIRRVLDIATSPGDYVLDSFAGTGTTGAVAHKMGRKWIMVELGEHCHTHIIPRLRKVIDGTDPGGVTGACNWKGGGGFRYYSLAPSLLQEDAFGNWVISMEYNSAMLAEAVCKLEGFHYAPSDESYWMHGHSTETDYIYITTQTLSREQLQKLNDEVGPNRSLLVCCGAYRTKKLDDFPQLTVKKIPKAVMQKCEWGKDDYSLEIKALPDPRPVDTEPVNPVLAELPKNKRKARKMIDSTPSLFSLEELE
jgi:adenine-specific DNA-methyltransferase